MEFSKPAASGAAERSVIWNQGSKPAAAGYEFEWATSDRWFNIPFLAGPEPWPK